MATDFPVPLSWREKYSAVCYVAPFLVFLAFLFSASQLRIEAYWFAPVWVIAMALVCLVCWPRDTATWPVRPLGSIAVGLCVYLLWIAPESLIPGYRQNILFSNEVFGRPHVSMGAIELTSGWVLAWRTARAVLIVPVVEELFWRGWLMRWLINPQFQNVPLGTYKPSAFWITAILFASEHGSYWEVGLIAGIFYNWWMIRSKSLTDCILMHAVTNAALSGYVILSRQWQYWQ